MPDRHPRMLDRSTIDAQDTLRRVFGESAKTFFNNTKSFIGHSMGNIVVRHYLGDLARQEPWKHPAAAGAPVKNCMMKLI